MKEEIMEFKKGEVVKIINPIRYEGFLKTNDLLSIGDINNMKLSCGFCKDKCYGIILEDLNGKRICNCCGERVVRASDKEKFLFYIHGQKALKEIENGKEV